MPYKESINYHVRLHPTNDKDIIEYLQKMKNREGAIKKCIRLTAAHSDSKMGEYKRGDLNGV